MKCPRCGHSAEGLPKGGVMIESNSFGSKDIEISRLQNLISQIKRSCEGKHHICHTHRHLSCHACMVLDILKDDMDNCSVCHGLSGGVKGNENIKNGIMVCDYCSVNNHAL
jgi:hypothetical protein